MQAPTTEAPASSTRRIALRALRILALLAVVASIGCFVMSILYDDELPKAQLSEGRVAVDGVMRMEAEFRQDHARFPEPAEQDKNLLVAQPHVTDVAFGPGGALTISYRGRHEIDGKTLTLTPYAEADGTVRWRCAMPDIAERWWPR